MNTGRYLREGTLSVWVFDELRDPLCGPKADIEKYLKSSHQHPGLAVELGPQAISISMENDRHIISYRFLKVPEFTVTSELNGQQLRRHYRRFDCDQGRAEVIVCKIHESHQSVKPKAFRIEFGHDNSLEQNVDRALAFKHKLAARLARVV